MAVREYYDIFHCLHSCHTSLLPSLLSLHPALRLFYVCICLSLYLFYLSVHFSVCFQSVCLTDFLSVFILSLFVSLFVSVSVSLCLCLSLFVFVSFCFFSFPIFSLLSFHTFDTDSMIATVVLSMYGR